MEQSFNLLIGTTLVGVSGSSRNTIRACDGTTKNEMIRLHAYVYVMQVNKNNKSPWVQFQQLLGSLRISYV